MSSRRIKWIDRTFSFDFPAGLYPEIIERLRGTPARVASRLADVPADILTLRDGETWSIQENVGHLLDADPLFAGRIDDFRSGAEILRPADMTNKRTFAAQYNERSLGNVLEGFRQVRAELVGRLEALEPEIFGRPSLHPRLNVPMRLVDSMYFQAEHDDFHLARMTELIQLFDPRLNR